jgi:hypothetical protein
MNTPEFFVKVYEQDNIDLKLKIEFIYGIENLLSFINDNKDKKISIYEGKCLLDWS